MAARVRSLDGFRSRWRVAEGTRLSLGRLDARSTDGAPGDKEATRSASAELREELVEQQARLYACLLYTSDAADE